jgi:DNA-binding MarR family transcriptional regulator
LTPEQPSGPQAEALKSLGEQLSDPCLKSSTRVLILVSLAINKRLGFLDLLQLTGMGKGSLSNHLEKLETGGYIRTRRTMVWGGHRVVAEITEKGLSAYGAYVSAMRALGSAEREELGGSPVANPRSDDQNTRS